MTRLGAVLALLAGCDWGLSRMNDQPRCEPGDATRWLPDRRCDQLPPSGTVPWRTPKDSGPPAITRASIERGADRFMRFCAPCHGTLGDGRSAIARDMTLRPPRSLHDRQIVAYDDEQIVDVISRGYGMMPAYAELLEPADRWAVVAFVRVLQIGQNVAVDELPVRYREEAARWLR